MDSVFDTYALLAGLGMSFAGFGTLAVTLGSRAGGDDARVDAHRLTNMLTASLTLVVVALLPAVLAALGFAERWQVGLPSLAVVLVTAFASPGLARRNLEIRRSPGFSPVAAVTNLASVIVAVTAFLMCAIGWFPVPPGALFLVGLVGLLLSSVIMFSRVAMSLLRPHNLA
ncbi:hypothetical protein H8M03_07035 [Sphingomonas sabuli]|uniref:Uncharacterized protein n=1 Tax=Sphingomonas sabuli TaxID=2764186 RepID=A0A7G9KZL9_9SPHN|nr:hypothetical protein [Sphingomonas sabuli]QNM81818.1 hypothetical protein H8M03_07035 [Sphingomonas sabuli]